MKIGEAMFFPHASVRFLLVKLQLDGYIGNHSPFKTKIQMSKKTLVTSQFYWLVCKDPYKMAYYESLFDTVNFSIYPTNQGLFRSSGSA